MMSPRWRWTSVVASLALTMWTGCGRPGEDGDDGGTPDKPVTGDTTEVNKEFEMPFDGECPSMKMGPDGAIHLLFRSVRSQAATLYYAKRLPNKNEWTTPIPVAGSENAAWRWFAWPKLAVGPDSRVHISWMPEPYEFNGLFYTSCQLCDGTDWKGRNDGTGNRFSKMTSDTVEFADICVTDNKEVHIVATQLDRVVPPHREQTDQMVHYFSANNGENWEKNQQILPLAFEDLYLKCVGNEPNLLMRFKTLYYGRYVADGTGARSWVFQKNLPHAGPGLSEMNFFNPPAGGLMTGFVYASWEYRDPLGVYYTKAENSATVLLSEIASYKYRPNNTIAGEDAQGRRVAIWADKDGFLHHNNWDGTAWSGDKAFTEAIQPLDTTKGLSKAAIYNYSPGHGWQGKILWPITAIVESKSSFYALFRAPTELTENGTTKSGRFHFIRYQPFGSATEGN